VCACPSLESADLGQKDWETQRKLAYAQIDKGRFGYWTVFVAGAGFLTDAYDVRITPLFVLKTGMLTFSSKIFAVNTVLPMLAVVYWGGKIPANQEVLINLSLLVGTFVGQFTVGVLADRYGRKRMYGIELLILTTATILMALCSKGALRGTNRLAWIVAWRL
jgi:PHS family inorganic phosphate transporter-like MFS transporter